MSDMRQRAHDIDQTLLWLGYAERAAAWGDPEAALQWLRRIRDHGAPLRGAERKRLQTLRALKALRGGL